MYKLAIVSLCFLTLLTGCNDENEVKTFTPELWNISILPISTRSVPINYKSIGTVVSDQRIGVSSRSTGYIRDILVLEGNKVTKGQVLVALDSSEVDGAIEQAKSAVNSAKLAIKDADIDVQRYNDLFKRGSVSENQMRKTQLYRDRASDQLLEAETSLSVAKSQRKYIKISSEINGIVVERHLRNGDLATPGKPILTIESSQGLFFDTYVAESQIKNIKKGAKVNVYIDALNQEIEGFVARVIPAGDPVTRRYKVKIALSNYEGLLSGMFGRVNIVLGSKESIVIPQSSVIERGGLLGVFVVNNNNEARFRWLQLGSHYLNDIEVRAGLIAGEKIILAANPEINEGDIVKTLPVQGK